MNAPPGGERGHTAASAVSGAHRAPQEWRRLGDGHDREGALTDIKDKGRTPPRRPEVAAPWCGSAPADDRASYEVASRDSVGLNPRDGSGPTDRRESDADRLAAVDDHCMAGRECAEIRRKPEHRGSDLLGPAHPADGFLTDHSGPAFGVPPENLSIIGVSMMPGQTALTLTPCAA